MINWQKQTLANGLRLVTVPMPHLHSAEMVCYLGVGSRDEAPELAGISHFLEHMLFRGTAAFASSLDLERAFEEIGGAVNAATDVETTCYHSRLQPDCLKRGAELFAEMLRRPTWKDLETERKIILEEALEDLNEEGEQINPDLLTNQLLWPGHPLSQPTIGTDDSLRRIDLTALQEHHRRYYTPGNTVIAVVGRITPEAALDAVTEAFGDWSQAAPVPPPLTAEAPREQTPNMVWVKDSSAQLTLQLAWPIPGRSSHHAVPLRLWRRILSWGGTSRLMLRLRETLGLTYSVEANLSLLDDCGCLSVDLAVHPDNLLPAFSEVLALIKQMREEPVPLEELERNRRNFRFDLQYSLDHTDDLAVRYGWGELVGYRRSLEDDLQDMEGIEAGQLLAAARELLTPGRLRGAVVGPWRAKDRQAIDRLLAGWQEL